MVKPGSAGGNGERRSKSPVPVSGITVRKRAARAGEQERTARRAHSPQGIENRVMIVPAAAPPRAGRIIPLLGNLHIVIGGFPLIVPENSDRRQRVQIGALRGRTLKQLPVVQIAVLHVKIPEQTVILRKIVSRNPVGTVAGIQEHSGNHLFLAGEAFTLARSFPRLVQRRQQHRRQNSDDCNNNEKFDQCEDAAADLPFRQHSLNHIRSPFPYRVSKGYEYYTEKARKRQERTAGDCNNKTGQNNTRKGACRFTRNQVPDRQR